MGCPSSLRTRCRRSSPLFEAEGVEELSETFYAWLLDEGHWIHYHKQPLKRWNHKKRADPHLLEEIEMHMSDTSTLILLGSEVQGWAKRQGLAKRVLPANYIELHLPTPDGKHARYWSPENPKIRTGIPRLGGQVETPHQGEADRRLKSAIDSSPARYSSAQSLLLSVHGHAAIDLRRLSVPAEPSFLMTQRYCET